VRAVGWMGSLNFLGQAGLQVSSLALFAAAHSVMQYDGSNRCAKWGW
jgi:hypothetical protein